MTQNFLEIIDARHDGAKTGKGAAYETEAEAQAAFDAVQEVPHGDFMLDLHTSEGLVDTKQIDAATFERLVGSAPLSADEYDAFDAAYWSAAQLQRGRESQAQNRRGDPETAPDMAGTAAADSGGSGALQ